MLRTKPERSEDGNVPSVPEFHQALHVPRGRSQDQSRLGRIFKGHCFKGCENDGMEYELVEVVNRLNQIFTSLSIFRHRLGLWQLQFKRIQLTAAHVAHD